MSVYSKFNRSVRKGIEAGRIDKEKHGAMDEPGWPIIKGKIDNVSPSVFLKYCETLGITELGTSQPVKEEAKPLSLVGNSKWKRQA